MNKEEIILGSGGVLNVKKITACCLACILVAVLILPGCGGETQSQQPAAQGEQVVQEDQTASPDPTPSSGGGEVAAILAKCKGIDEVSF